MLVARASYRRIQASDHRVRASRWFCRSARLRVFQLRQAQGCAASGSPNQKVKRATVMTPYAQFKLCLIGGWPSAKMRAVMVSCLLDFGEASPFPVHEICIGSYFQKGISTNDFDQFLNSINMPTIRVNADVSLYLARFYPQTSAFLFEGGSKEAAIKIFLGEKKARVRFVERGSFDEAKKEFRKAAGYKAIRLRSLSKAHDWNTVK